MEKDYIKVGHITDIHMMNNENNFFHGCSPFMNFNKVISDIRLQDCDLLILTGDISETGTVESYQLVKKILDKLSIPTHLIPGNHDNIHNMSLIFNRQLINIHTVLNAGSWDICYLDTIVTNKNHGFLTDNTLTEFYKTLDKCNSPNIIILSHHQPINVGTPLIDQFNIQNAIKIKNFELQDKKMALFLFGHVHNDYNIIFGNMFYSSAPATCFQFKKGTTKLDLDPVFGYKTYKLYDEYMKMDTSWLSTI